MTINIPAQLADAFPKDQIPPTRPIPPLEEDIRAKNQSSTRIAAIYPAAASTWRVLLIDSHSGRGARNNRLTNGQTTELVASRMLYRLSVLPMGPHSAPAHLKSVPGSSMGNTAERKGDAFRPVLIIVNIAIPL